MSSDQQFVTSLHQHIAKRREAIGGAEETSQNLDTREKHGVARSIRGIDAFL